MVSVEAFEKFLPGDRSVKIASIEDGVFILHEQALAKILNDENIRNKPLMIVSVAGAFRKGKSFMLTYLLRYLRENGQNNKDWLGFRALRDGFSWRAGRNPETMGIVMWREPLFVEDQDGRTVAVLLLDTQGLFDHQTSKALCTAIFAFSTLLSSVQVYNVESQIQKDHLEYLEFFVSYAASMADGKKPFQKLVFLVRDWSNPVEYEYGLDKEAEGKTYLTEILDEEKPAVEDFAKKLRESFENLQCFLMPHPGLKVAVASKKDPFEGDPKDIDRTFKMYAGQFGDSLFHRSNVVPKKLDGIEIVATDLLNYAIACGRHFEGGKLPEFASMVEATATTLCIRISESVLVEYEKKMQPKEGVYEEDRVLLERHNKIVEKLVSSFASQVKFADAALVTKYTSKLESTLHERFRIVRGLNEVELGKMEAKMAARTFSLVKEFDQKATAKLLASNLDEAVCKDMQFDSMERFALEFRGYPKLLTHTGKLEEKLKITENRCLKYLQNRKRALPEKKQRYWIDTFRSHLGELLSKYVDEELLRSKLSTALVHCKDRFSSHDYKYEWKLVKDILEEEEKRILLNNSRHEEPVRLQFEHEIKELQTAYMRAMDEGMKSAFVEATVLKTIHEDMKKMLRKKFYSNKKIEYEGQRLWNEYCDKLFKNLDEEYKRRVERNKENETLYYEKIREKEDFFAKAGAVVIMVIGAPIAIALGIPVLIGYGLYKGVTSLAGKIKKSFKKSED